MYRNDAEKSPQRHYLQVRLKGAMGNTQGIGATVTLYANRQQQSQLQSPTRGYLSSVSPVLQFGLGMVAKVDSVVVAWAGGKRQTLRNVPANQVLDLDESKATEQRTRLPASPTLASPVPSPVAYEQPVQAVNDFDRQPLLTRELSHEGPCQATGDVNGDGLPDLFVGGTPGQAAALFLQQPGGRFTRQPVPALEADKAHQDAAAAFFDANGDGFTDLYVASGGYHSLTSTDQSTSAGPELLQDRLYLNDGKGHFTRSPNALPPMLVSKGCVTVQDVNNDGHPDLFVGGRVVPGRYPETPTSYLLINDGKGKFTDHTAQLAPDLQHIGMVTDAAWADLDGDGKTELVVVGEWMPVSVFGRTGKTLTNKTTTYLGKAYTGWWNKLALGDFNGDKKPDLIVGNWGENSQVRVSPAQPADLYYADFDKNGSVEPILCCYVQGKSHLFLTRDELLNQIGGYRTRYPTYASYADATVKNVFDGEALSAAAHLTANHLQTSLFLSSSAGKYTVGTLPAQAQYAPVHTITMLDANHDGQQDVLLCGNDSHAKIRLGKLDANYGVLLSGNGRGAFSYVPQTQSGFALKGDVRSVTQLNDILLFGINERKMVAYKLR